MQLSKEHLLVSAAGALVGILGLYVIGVAAFDDGQVRVQTVGFARPEDSAMLSTNVLKI